MHCPSQQTLQRLFLWCVSTCVIVQFLLAWTTPTYAEREQQDIFFEQQVAPLLSGHCLTCHGSDKKGELDLRSRETAHAGGESGSILTPGNPEESLLYEHVASGAMPPEKPLEADEIELLRRWIEAGAYYPDQPIDPLAYSSSKRAGYDWWSLQPLHPVQPSKESAASDTKIPSAAGRPFTLIAGAPDHTAAKSDV